MAGDLRDLSPERVDAARVPILQDVELGTRQVEGGPARSVQGIHTGPWGGGVEREGES